MDESNSAIKRSECVSIVNAFRDLGITRNTLNSYISAFGITKHKFPFDTRLYITKADLERIRQFIEEKKQSL